ncbi:MAG TPA: cupredoxin domain-containing protein [Candidatus Acidoferrum sp.]|nr:cupredoxin domain-containing protein [Candidatus Acidoferrum sp.]
MKKSVILPLLSMVGVLVLTPAIFFSPHSSVLAQEQNVQVIELTAKKYEYSPPPVHVNAGAKVQLKITATDHDHGFKIAVVPDGAEANATGGLVFTSPQDCWQLKKGETTTIEFLAQTPGTYTYRCCHTCGLGHRGMKGQIVVDSSAI